LGLFRGSTIFSMVGYVVLTAVPACVFAAEFDCLIEPRQVLELRSPIEGLIERVNVDRGDYVKKGQDLAVLDTSVDRVAAEIARHRSRMDGAIKAWDARSELSSKKSGRMDELHKQNFMSAQAREEAAAEKRVAEAELRDALDNRRLADLEFKRQTEIIRLKTIRSPVNGVITERLMNPGELAESGVGRKPLLKMAEIDTLHVEVLLPAEAYGKVKPGMLIDVSPEIPAGTRHRARVKVIDRVLDAASGTFGVRLELPNSERRIPAGIRCRANFPDIDAAAMAKGRDAARVRK
jgi:RND family efflux transporter MFP subunit